MVEKGKPAWSFSCEGFSIGDSFFDRNWKGLEELRFSEQNQRIVICREGSSVKKKCYFLPYQDNHITIARLPAEPKPDGPNVLLTSPMDGCNLLSKELNGCRYIVHDNYTMNLRDEDKDDPEGYDESPPEEDGWLLSSMSVADAVSHMAKKGLHMVVFEGNGKESLLGAKFLMKRGEYEKHCIPLLRFSAEEGDWLLETDRGS